MTTRRPVAAGPVGVMGGTFDPIHDGHLAIAAAARDVLGLARVVFVPAGTPPHRPAGSVAPAADRLAMVEAAIQGIAGFEASRIELDRPGPSFTADTLEAMAGAERAAGREPDLVFILSAETLEQLPTWHAPERVLASARLAVVPRPGHASPSDETLETWFPGHADRIIRLDGPAADVSGTTIRRRVAAGLAIDDLVPAPVAAYIAAHRLYRAASPPPPSEDHAPVTDPVTVATDPVTPAPTADDHPSPDGLPRRAAGEVPLRDRSSLDLARRIVELAEDKKAADIVLLDLSALTTMADHFIVCSGGSERQLDAIADGIIEGLRGEKVRPIGREGTAASHWVLIDFGAVVVHVFTPPERDYYQLERHWSEAKTILRVQ